MTKEAKEPLVGLGGLLECLIIQFLHAILRSKNASESDRFSYC